MGAIQTVGGGIVTDPAMLQGMDLETAAMVVQIQRTNLIEVALKGQLQSVADRNAAVSERQKTMTEKRAELAAIPEKIAANEAKVKTLTELRDQLQKVNDRDPNGWTGLGWNWAGDGAAESHRMALRVEAEGLVNRGPGLRDCDGNGTLDAHGTTAKGWIDQLNAKITGLNGQNDSLRQREPSLKTEIENLQANIDSLLTTQQLDMLRLQSLMTKRNEAFDVATNTAKKFADSRSSIVGNLR